VTEGNARAAANVLLGAAGVLAAYAIWKKPALRRVALVAARWWLGVAVPVYLLAEPARARVEGRTAA
jgi:hypothetical protein